MRHLVSVWNPSYASDAMDAHLEVLLRWAEREEKGEAQRDDTYVWWAKVRSANRQQALPHRDEILALDAQCEHQDETHLYLTDYRSLYVASVGEITADNILKDAAGEVDHMPAYYSGLSIDFWFRLFDIRRLVANDTVAVIAELRHLRNTRYHDRPVSLYGGMVELPLIVSRDDDVRWFTDREQLTDGKLWAVRDAYFRNETERIGADLRDNVLGHAVWSELEPASRTFLATGEAMFRAHRDDLRFDFSAPSVEFAKAVETELNALIFPALRRALSKKKPAERETRVDGRVLDLGGSLGHQTLGVIRTLLQRDPIVQHELPNVLPQDGRGLIGELPAALDTLGTLRNPAAHSEVITRDPALKLRETVLGIGTEGLVARIARARMRVPPPR